MICGATPILAQPVTNERRRIHEKVVIIDNEIVWHGSLNVLSHTDRTDESMTRVANAGLAKALAANMSTLGEFEAALKSMKSGQIAQMHYDVYATLFPPGEPDQDARARAAAVAKTHGCVIENRPQDPQVIFKKTI